MFERTWTTMHALQCQFFFYLADLQRQNHAVDNVTMLALFSHSRPKRPPISACPRLFAWLPATARRESYLIWQRSSVPSFLARHVVLEYTFFCCRVEVLVQVLVACQIFFNSRILLLGSVQAAFRTPCYRFAPLTFDVDRHRSGDGP